MLFRSDLNGNLVDSGSDSTLSIHFAKTLGTGTVDGLSPDVSAVAGVALKTVTGHTAGALTLAASSGAVGAGSTVSFTVVHAGADHVDRSEERRVGQEWGQRRGPTASIG